MNYDEASVDDASEDDSEVEVSSNRSSGFSLEPSDGLKLYEQEKDNIIV